MPVLIDNQINVYSYRHALRYARKNGLPTAHWASVANSFRTMIGPLPGRAWLLMVQQDLPQVLTGAHTITFNDALGGMATFQGMYAINSGRVSRGGLNDPLALYVMEFADPRVFARNQNYAMPALKQYNVRVPSGGQTYYADSLNAGNPWTWQQILDDLWATVNAAALGASPQLPAAPTGTPENFRFLGVPAWTAYNQVLDHVGMDFSWEPQQGVSQITQRTIPDPNFDNATIGLRNRLLFQFAPFQSTATQVPEQLRVYFPQLRQHYGSEQSTNWAAGHQDTMTPLYSLDVPDPNGALPGIVLGTRASMFDDLPAILDFTGNVTNLANLQARANERGANFFASLRGNVAGRDLFIWQGIITDANVVSPRSYVTGIRWYEQGNGFQTEVVRYPPWMPPAALRFSEDMAPMMGAGSDMRVSQALFPPTLGETGQLGTVYPEKLQPLQITGGVIAGQTKIYPANVIRIKPDDQTTANEEQAYAYIPDGSLDNNQIVQGRLLGAPTFNGTQLPIYLVVASAATAAALIKINGGADGDGNVAEQADHTFDGTIQTVSTTDLSLTAGANVWFYDPNKPGKLSVTPTGYYTGMLVPGGQYNGRPLYVRDDFNFQVKQDNNAVILHQLSTLFLGRTPTLHLQDFKLLANGVRGALLRTAGFPDTAQTGESTITLGPVITSVSLNPDTCALTGNTQTLIIDFADGLVKNCVVNNGTF